MPPASINELVAKDSIHLRVTPTGHLHGSDRPTDVVARGARGA